VGEKKKKNFPQTDKTINEKKVQINILINIGAKKIINKIPANQT